MSEAVQLLDLTDAEIADLVRDLKAAGEPYTIGPLDKETEPGDDDEAGIIDGGIITLGVPAIIVVGAWLNRKRKKTKVKVRKTEFPDGKVVSETEIIVTESATDKEIVAEFVKGLGVVLPSLPGA